MNLIGQFFLVGSLEHYFCITEAHLVWHKTEINFVIAWSPNGLKPSLSTTLSQICNVIVTWQQAAGV